MSNLIKTTCGQYIDYLLPLNRNQYIEIRLSRIGKDDLPQQLYNEVKLFAKAHPDIIIKKSSQFFIKTKEQMQSIMDWNNQYFSFNSKMCYGLIKRYKDKEGELAGGYKNIKVLDKIFFDIESTSHGMLKGVMKELLYKYVVAVAENLRRYKLYDYTIIDSGSGFHLIYKIAPITIVAGTKEKYKSFIQKVIEEMKNEMFEIDSVYDLTRIAGMPGSMNNKRQRHVTIKKLNNNINKDFKFRMAKKKKVSEKDIKHIFTNLPQVKSSLEWKILTKRPPAGERHNTLIFALKLFFKAKGIKDVTIYENILSEIYGGSVCLNPEDGTEDKTYNKGIIINWCKRNNKWCEENGIKYEKSVDLNNDGSISIEDTYTYK